MRFLLISPPSPFLLNPMVFPPLGLLYLGASLEKLGVEVQVVDMASFGSPFGHSPDFIGISGATPHIPAIKELVPKLREEYKGVPIIVGGPHFTAVPTDGERLGVDAVCVGDGEYVVRRFINGARGILNHWVKLDEWPMPARHLIDLKQYQYTLTGSDCTSAITSRGCPFHCAYCSHNWPGVRYRSAQKFEVELADIKNRGYDAVQLYDDELNISEKRVVEIGQVLKNQGMKWRCFIRSNLFTVQQALDMHHLGCVEVCCGVESGSDLVLERVNKKATVEDATRARRIAKMVGLRFKAFCMIGLPGETVETVKETKEWLLKNKPDEFDFTPFTPYPGSPIAAKPAEFGMVILRNYWDTPSHPCTSFTASRQDSSYSRIQQGPS